MRDNLLLSVILLMAMIFILLICYFLIFFIVTDDDDDGDVQRCEEVFSQVDETGRDDVICIYAGSGNVTLLPFSLQC